MRTLLVQSGNVELSSVTERDLSAKKPCLHMNVNPNLSSKAGKWHSFFGTGETGYRKDVFH